MTPAARTLLSTATILWLLQSVGAEQVLSLTQQNFGQTTSKDTWLINFHAPWCAHCKKLAPVYEKVAQHFHSDTKSGVRVAKVDAQAETELAERFSIEGYPTILLYQTGGQVHVHKGARSFDDIVRFVESHKPKAKPVAGGTDTASAQLAAMSERALARLRELREYAREVVTHLTIAHVAWSYGRLAASASGLIFAAFASMQYLDRRREE